VAINDAADGNPFALLGGLLFAWQMPHFFALSFWKRDDYARADHKMMAIDDPDGCELLTPRASVS